MSVLAVPGVAEFGGPSLFNWINLVKTGLKGFSGLDMPPLIRAETDYFDHYHETMRHYSPQEQEIVTAPNIATVNYWTNKSYLSNISQKENYNDLIKIYKFSKK